MSGKMKGKVAVITGGGSGIGLATAKLFIQEGAEVVITDRNEERLGESSRTLGHQMTAIRSDTAVLGDIDDLFRQVKAKHEKIDVLFVNAGILIMQPIMDVDEESFDRLVNTNFKGLFFTIQKALPLMSKGGSIILNSSAAAHKGFPNTAVYAGTKAAVRSLARTISGELIDRGIRVNSISPGPIDTPIFETLVPIKEVAAMKEGYAQMVPLKRIGLPEEVARYAVFLASDDSAYVIGTDLVIDGGLAKL